MPMSIASVTLFSPGWRALKASADSMVMITKVTQNPGFESCLKALVYRIASTVMTGTTAMTHQYHLVRLTITSKPAMSRISAASHASE